MNITILPVQNNMPITTAIYTTDHQISVPVIDVSARRNEISLFNAFHNLGRIVSMSDYTSFKQFNLGNHNRFSC